MAHINLWRLHQQVRPAGGRLARLANGRRLASEPRLPRVCQALRQCYCHEREGVIKTERPAVLVKSAVDQFSPLHHLEALQQVDSLWQQVLGLFSCPDRIARVPCCVPLLPDFLGTPRPQPLHRHAHFGLGAPAASSHPALGGLGKKWDRLFCLPTQPNAPHRPPQPTQPRDFRRAEKGQPPSNCVTKNHNHSARATSATATTPQPQPHNVCSDHGAGLGADARGQRGSGPRCRVLGVVEPGVQRDDARALDWRHGQLDVQHWPGRQPHVPLGRLQGAVYVGGISLCE